MSRWGLAFLIVLSVVFAGCTKGDEPRSLSIDVLGPTAEELARTPGSIEGLVVTTAFEPIPGARITLLRENVSTTSDSSGHFRFPDLVNGRYLLSAEAAGFVTRSVQARTLNGTVTELNLTLERAIVIEPRRDTREFEGYVSCHAQAATPVGLQSHGCAAADPNHRDRFEIPVAPDARNAVVEVVWSAADNPATGPLHVLVETVGYGALDATLGEASGEGYVRIHVRESDFSKYYVDGGLMRVVVSLAEPGTPPVAAAVQLRFTMFASVFHTEAGPDDYSLRA